ncbi:7-cyano-7-deazaguanine synthase QueC [Ktedonosporobacter rubrisoli]|uniref:7-cyano-7-deazaguanine synthase n=1 Tax=Ktedonosporobacter rubrisoli TaxID=2509675 RepID=A0A4P6K5A1_KTERU|nr:7-cyano-7-deazaguanine synthase QueC [Ktedonosporobacter rubrisoli]QBD83162.1 7-cyano-7-deazaguanine synthase QueC [Ktedonosporobacter rubrisoli]
MTTTRERDQAVLVVSGGMDSCVLAYYYAAAGFDLHLLSFDYGQKHVKELEYAHKYIARLRERFAQGEQGLRVQHEILSLPIASLLPDSTCALLNDEEPMPYGHYSDESMKTTVVPYRNPNMLLQAATVAWGEGASVVAYAAHQGDHAIYPDCRPAFVNAFNAMLAAAMDGPAPIVQTPFLQFSKAQIARLGASLDVPFELTWSCYEGGRKGYGELHCGRCGTCVERRWSFAQAGLSDPTHYASEALDEDEGFHA